MKKSVLLHVCSALALLSLVTSRTSAGFVSPTLRVPGIESPAQSNTPLPGPPPVVWTVINTQDDGPGSLRHAISNSLSGDTIQFALQSPAVIILQSTLVIDKDLQILGPGPDRLIVSRTLRPNAPSFRVFLVNDGVVTIAGMTILNGRAINTDNPFNDNVGGGILNFGTLTVSDCVVARNVAPDEDDGHGFGGGIFSQGALTLINSTFRDNSATYAGGGVCTFHSTNLVAEGCTISDNFAGVQGGGLNFQGVHGRLKNCTIAGNLIDVEGFGSGLQHIVFENEGADLTLTACTIAHNGGGTNGGINIAALPNNNGIVTRMIGTLVANNPARNFVLEGNPPLTSLGHNLDNDGTSGLANGVNGDIVGTLASPINARLGLLQDNGGPTRTVALLPGSPALDAGDCEDADGAPLVTDQRGYPRPQGPACDIGAFENQPPTVVCPQGGTIECSQDLAVTVNDPDGDALTIVWIINGTAIETNLLSAVHPPQPRIVRLQAAITLGTNTVTVRVSDGKAAAVECSTTVIVREDTTPPRIIEIKAHPEDLWQPNHKLVPVSITVRAEDCGPVQCRIISVQSNEPVGLEPDWIITGDLTLLLRAERLGPGRGRVYTVTVQCRDAAGNISQSTVEVAVPHNGPGKTAGRVSTTSQ